MTAIRKGIRRAWGLTRTTKTAFSVVAGLFILVFFAGSRVPTSPLGVLFDHGVAHADAPSCGSAASGDSSSGSDAGDAGGAGSDAGGGCDGGSDSGGSSCSY